MQVVRQHVQYLIDCRPHSIAMGIVIRWLRGEISKIRPDATLAEVRMCVYALRTLVTHLTSTTHLHGWRQDWLLVSTAPPACLLTLLAGGPMRACIVCSLVVG
jgi:hypothetical protein